MEDPFPTWSISHMSANFCLDVNQDLKMRSETCFFLHGFLCWSWTWQWIKEIQRKALFHFLCLISSLLSYSISCSNHKDSPDSRVGDAVSTIWWRSGKILEVNVWWQITLTTFLKNTLFQNPLGLGGLFYFVCFLHMYLWVMGIWFLNMW